VSNSLKELQSWNLVKVVHLRGDRRDHFETSTDVWELFVDRGRTASARNRSDHQRTARLSGASGSAGRTGRHQRKNHGHTGIHRNHSTLADEMLRLKPETLMKTLGTTAKLSRTFRGSGKDA
jgi:hypothetical protein